MIDFDHKTHPNGYISSFHPQRCPTKQIRMQLCPSFQSHFDFAYPLTLSPSQFRIAELTNYPLRDDLSPYSAFWLQFGDEAEAAF